MFIDDNQAYLDWLKENQEGYVVNCNRIPRPEYLILHYSNCEYISGTESSGLTNEMYIKVCSNSFEELVDWSEKTVGGPMTRQCECNQ